MIIPAKVVQDLILEKDLTKPKFKGVLKTTSLFSSQTVNAIKYKEGSTASPD